jgi:NAD(P)H dehydrogenase (quinone)
MAKIVIMYHSKTGNTEMMAKSVAEGAKEVVGAEVELLKVGRPFSISILNEADAIILGSPSYYGGLTPELRTVLESVKSLKETGRLDLSNKVGGVFASYAWDGGWVTDKLVAELQDLGIEVIATPIAAIDKQGAMGIRIDEESLKQCKELGKSVAMQFAV